MLLATGLNTLILVFEILLTVKLEGAGFSWRVVFIPIFVLTVYCIASCSFACRHKRDVEVSVCVCVFVLLMYKIATEKIISLCCGGCLSTLSTTHPLLICDDNPFAQFSVSFGWYI